MMTMLWILLAVTCVMSLVSFILMGVDKRRAKKNQWRVKEKSLFLSALLLGGIGGTAGMFFFHHKTKHWYFRWGFPAIAAVQVVLLVLAALRLR